MSDRREGRAAGLRTLVMRMALGGMSISLTFYALAVGINSDVTGRADWWPYSWLTAFAALAAVSAVLWLILALWGLVTHSGTNSTANNQLVRSKSNDGILNYRTALLTVLQHRIGTYVELPVVSEDADDDVNSFEARLTGGTAIALVAESGAGKTQLSRAVAIRALTKGRVVVWISFDEYERGQLDLLLSRSIAPHTLLEPETLLKSSAEPLLIVDAVDSGPAELREPFFSQLLALRQRTPFSLLVTSTHWSTHLPDFPRATIEAPTAKLRGDLRSAYQIPTDADLPDAFVTPLEISIAGECLADLRPSSTPLELLGKYIRRRSPDESVRAGLWIIADLMTHQVRSALPVDTIRTALHRFPMRPSDINRVLASPLLTLATERVRFTHNELAYFLAAESLVVGSGSASELLARLQLPLNSHLAPRALGLERDEARRSTVLFGLADPALLMLALEGRLGAGAVTTVSAEIDRVLDRANARLVEQHLQVVDGTQSVIWTSSSSWTESDLATLSAYGFLVARNGAADRLVSLLDHMDAHLSREMADLRDAGLTNPISLAVERTYANAWSERGLSPGATIVVQAIRSEAMERFDDGENSQLIENLLNDADYQSWGRLYVAALLITHSRSSTSSAAHVPRLIEVGWRARGYHIRLEVLMAAASVARFVSGHLRDQIVESLNSIDPPQHLFLSTQLVDTLAIYGEIKSERTVEDILVEIRATLSSPHDPTSPGRALGVIASMFEAQDIVGPYYEAVENLEDQDRQLLYALALGAEHSLFHLSFVVGGLVDGPTLDQPVAIAAMERLATETPPESYMPQESVSGHLEALRGWHRISPHRSLPDVDQAGTERDRAWRLFDWILIACLSGTADTHLTRSYWDELIHERSAAGIRVLMEIKRGAVLLKWAPYDLLVRTFESRVRALLETGLRPGSRLVRQRVSIYDDPLVYVIRQLATIGDETSAELLRHLRDDNDVGREATAAIRSIEDRG